MKKSSQRWEKVSGIGFGLVVLTLLLAGCDSLRFAPTETQKQNAWLHNRTAQLAADKARVEDTSEQLEGLTSLCAAQSRSFSSYYGMPKEFPPADTPEQILAQSSWQLAQNSLTESSERPDAWELADNALELGIGIAALLGGVYGTRAVGFLKEARTKSKALKEIVEGNELFKSQNSESTDAFKQAHRNQSPETRQIVTGIKTQTAAG
jgi:hypothetical protein